MSLATSFITSFFVLLLLVLGYYFYIEKPKTVEKKQSNVIPLQTDGFDFILYQGKIKEMMTDYQRFLAEMDIIVYSKSIFIGFLEPKYAYIDLPAKAIHSVKYEPTKLTIHCYRQMISTSKITIKSNSTKSLYLLAKKIDFISRRSKKTNAI
ncbi:hypothetical protein TEPIDINF_001763 [Tepidibacillus infernus]|uniref:Uncharacterized protein n=1 Tax=Tepidibacillus decaturensis TaxID=1413211 RepID=A0A135L5R8_9BACI|nr:hypothetical protein [Tepidibacillus decaturensis]KXG44249.1 hypothetical protein U473_09710 [Tepidibacillus decaturensis]